jgi:uncharacterized protein YegP (UPF0339 family)
MAAYFEVYADRAGGFRWRLVDAGNHRILADSAEAYTRRPDATRAITTLLDDLGVHTKIPVKTARD